MDTFAIRLKTIRVSKNLRQDDIAERLGVSKQLISMWENGKRFPSLDVFMELVRILGVESNDLAPTANPNDHPNIYIALKDVNRELTDAERKAIALYARFIIDKADAPK